MSSVLALSRYECPSAKCKGRMSTFELNVCIHCGHDRLAGREQEKPLSPREQAIEGSRNRGRERLRLGGFDRAAVKHAKRKAKARRSAAKKRAAKVWEPIG